MKINLLAGVSLLAWLGCGAPTEKAAPAPEKPAVTASTLATTAATSKKARPPKGKPEQDKKLSNDDRKAYRVALNEGRTQQKAKKYDEAIAGFDKALALFPDDPRALSEKGWAEFFAKKPADAEAHTREAIKRTTNNDLLGSSYYNLGRIQEDQGKNKEAITSYRESLQARPGNKIVKERLSKLNASLVEKEPFAATALDPLASFDEFCKAHASEANLDEVIQCDPLETSGIEQYSENPTAVLAKSGPYEEARLFFYEPNFMEAYYYLAIKTKDGWFVSPESILSVYNPGAFGIHESLVIDQFEIKDVIPGGPPEVVLQLNHQRYDSDMGINEVEDEDQTTLLVCSLGASGKPSCVGPIVIAELAKRSIFIEDDDADKDIKHEGFFDFAWKLEWAFADGKLVIKGKPHKKMDEDEKASIGSHALTFP